MPDRREALAAVLAEQSPDDEDLRDWLTDRTEFVADALAAAGIHLCTEGQAVVDGEVVTLGAGRTYMVDTTAVEMSHPVDYLRGKVLFGLACDSDVLPLKLGAVVWFIPLRSEAPDERR